MPAQQRRVQRVRQRETQRSQCTLSAHQPQAQRPPRDSLEPLGAHGCRPAPIVQTDRPLEHREHRQRPPQIRLERGRAEPRHQHRLESDRASAGRRLREELRRADVAQIPAADQKAQQLLRVERMPFAALKQPRHQLWRHVVAAQHLSSQQCNPGRVQPLERDLQRRETIAQIRVGCEHFQQVQPRGAGGQHQEEFRAVRQRPTVQQAQQLEVVSFAAMRVLDDQAQPTEPLNNALDRSDDLERDIDLTRIARDD